MANARANPARLDTLRLVRNCPNAFGAVFGELLTNDSLAANDVQTYYEMVRIASQFEEGGLFVTALGIANDASRPAQVRFGGMSLVAAMTVPRGLEPQLWMFTTANADFQPKGCVPHSSGDQWRYAGEVPMPSNARSLALGSAQAAIAGSAPNAVKFAASCITAAFGPPATPGGSGLTYPAPTFSFVPLCGRRIALRHTNEGMATIHLGWLVAGVMKPHPKPVTLGPRPEGEPYVRALAAGG